MARARTVIVCGVCLFAATPAAWSACRFQNDEIVNPFEAGCGDVILTYTESDNTGNNIALGYPVPIPVDSLTPVAGFRTYDSLFARHQSLLMMHDEVDGQIVGETVAGRDHLGLSAGRSPIPRPRRALPRARCWSTAAFTRANGRHQKR